MIRNLFRAFGIVIYAFCLNSQTTMATGIESETITALKTKGNFRCKETERSDGVFCIGSNPATYILIPKNLRQHRMNIFYAHGLTGVCGPGASGENFLKDTMDTLRRDDAIAVMPFRKKALDMNFRFGAFIKKLDELLDSEDLPLRMVGHSAGGKFLATKLANTPEVASRVSEVLLLDAAYNVDKVLPLWKKVRSDNPTIKIKSVSSTTADKSRFLEKEINRDFPNTMRNWVVVDAHCLMPKYFDESFERN